MSRTAEIAGGGFAGLGTSIALARTGWSVRVHERSSEIRELGAGIFITHNGLFVLDEYGLMDELQAEGVEIQSAAMIDSSGKVLHDRKPSGQSRKMWTFPRHVLIDALYRKALEAGVEVVTDSEAVTASPSGTISFADGSHARGDLVVAADGHRSAIRESLGLTKRTKLLPTVSVRYLIQGRDLEPEPATKQYWSGKRRMAVTACAPDKTYVYLSCPRGDPAESQQNGWTNPWRATFPLLHEVFDVLEKSEPHIAHYSIAETTNWIRGSVALVGDAAHALPPTLGQGANLALVNGRSLATFLEAIADIDEALIAWERRVRPVTDAAQRWSSRYDRATTHWPEKLSKVRNGIVRLFGTVPYLNAHMRTAERTPPITDTAELAPNAANQ